MNLHASRVKGSQTFARESALDPDSVVLQHVKRSWPQSRPPGFVSAFRSEA